MYCTKCTFTYRRHGRTLSHNSAPIRPFAVPPQPLLGCVDAQTVGGGVGYLCDAMRCCAAGIAAGVFIFAALSRARAGCLIFVCVSAV